MPLSNVCTLELGVWRKHGRPQTEGSSRQQLAPSPGDTDLETGKNPKSVDKDLVELLDDSKALEFVEFNPTVEVPTAWTPSETMVSFLEKNFNHCLPDSERNATPQSQTLQSSWP